jgi:hypothetical protein
VHAGVRSKVIDAADIVRDGDFATVIRSLRFQGKTKLQYGGIVSKYPLLGTYRVVHCIELPK